MSNGIVSKRLGRLVRAKVLLSLAAFLVYLRDPHKYRNCIMVEGLGAAGRPEFGEQLGRIFVQPWAMLDRGPYITLVLTQPGSV